MGSSFRAGDQHSLIQACLINRLADSPERIEPLLATLALVEEVSNRLFDQFVKGTFTERRKRHGLPEPEQLEDYPVHAAFAEGRRLD